MPARSRPRPHLADAVYTALRRALLAGEFDRGEPLTEHQLCGRFGVSRTPVREALVKLERDGLLRVVPKKGAFVRSLSHDEIRDLYQVREALEALAVRLAAPRLDREELLQFESRFRELRARGRTVTHADLQRIGEEFHRYLAKAADNDQLLRLLEEVREQVRAVWVMSILAPRRVRGLIGEHLAIIDALKRGQGARAASLMASHVSRVRDAIFRLVD